MSLPAPPSRPTTDSVVEIPAGVALDRLATIMVRLRDPDGGCPWDLAQSFETIAPYTIEEAYEVADAIAAGDMAALREELGDLLLQVVFHARIAEEAGHFTLAEVAAGIAAKMERRHPHVFADATAASDATAQLADWEAIKAAEKSRDSALAGVASALPALMRAEKLQRRAARTGFDWPDATGARAKIIEELAEFEAASTAEEQLDEGGDLLFAVVNTLRHHGIDPEAALRGANAKFERRFRAMEAMARAAAAAEVAEPGAAFAALDLAAKETLWAAVKVTEQKR